MFPREYYPGTYYAPRYFPQSQGQPANPPPPGVNMALTNVALLRGLPTIVGTGINATGTVQSNQFSVVRNPMSESKVTLQAIGTYTVLDGNIEVSSDGGTTWGILVEFDFLNIPIFAFDTIAGVIYRLNFKNVTQSVPPNILATLG